MNNPLLNLSEEVSKSIAYYHMKKIEKRLNRDIGNSWWKKYIAAAFWNNMATPINLFITLLTAIISGQANTENLISDGLYVNLTVVTLIMTTLNTFFRPHIQMNINIESMNKYNKFGNQFEEIYYSTYSTEQDITVRYNRYVELQKEINKFENENTVDNFNYLTDIIYIMAIKSCLKAKEKWITHHYESDDDSDSDSLRSLSKKNDNVVIDIN